MRRRLIRRQKSAPDRLGHNCANPRQITTQRNPSGNIKKKKQKKNEDLSRRGINRQGQADDKSNGTNHQTATHPPSQNKGPIAHSLHKSCGWDLENIHQGSQGRHHPQHGGRGSQFFEIEHHGQPHDQIKRAGVKNLKEKCVEQGPPGQPKPALLHAEISRGRSSGKKITSRIESEPDKSIARRSTPNPIPPAGGIPLCNASRKSSSTFWVCSPT